MQRSGDFQRWGEIGYLGGEEWQRSAASRTQGVQVNKSQVSPAAIHLLCMLAQTLGTSCTCRARSTGPVTRQIRDLQISTDTAALQTISCTIVYVVFICLDIQPCQFC